MSDIVEMLRHPKATQAEMEAAAEIERLRSEAERRSRIEDERSQRAVEMEQEIERLRGLVGACSIYLKEDETPAQRIERERADTEAVLKLLVKEKRDNERLRGDISYLESQNSKTIHRAAAEIERLRGLLRDVDDGLDDYWITTKEGVAWICRRSEALGE